MFYNYVLEIKNRFILLLVSWCFTILTCYLYKNTLLFLLIKLNSKFYSLDSFYFIFTNLTDVFAVYLQISYFISNQFLIFFFIYHFLIFLSPGLFKFEYILLKSISFNFFVFFFISIFVLNFYIMPLLCNFFLSFQETCKINVFFESKITEYFNLYIVLYITSIAIGQCFGFILLVFNKIKLKKKFVIQSRKLLYSLFFITATITTPPDVISQIIVGFCFIFVYELSILIILLKTVFIKHFNY